MTNKLGCILAKSGAATMAGFAALALAASAQAATLFMVDPNPGGEHLNLTNVKDSTSSTGTVVSPNDVAISVTGPSDFASGFANIKPIKDGTLTDLIFTPTNDTQFDSFSFRGQDVVANQTIDVIVTDQSGATQTFTVTEGNANQDFTRFGIIAAQSGETIKSVELQNSGGFKEAKQFEFDLAPVPEPATWAMMILGFGALGLNLRKQRLSARRAA